MLFLPVLYIVGAVPAPVEKDGVVRTGRASVDRGQDVAAGILGMINLRSVPAAVRIVVSGQIFRRQTPFNTIPDRRKALFNRASQHFVPDVSAGEQVELLGVNFGAAEETDGNPEKKGTSRFRNIFAPRR